MAPRIPQGSSRIANPQLISVLWHIGNDIRYVPNQRSRGYIIGGKIEIAPIFCNNTKSGFKIGL